MNSWMKIYMSPEAEEGGGGTATAAGEAGAESGSPGGATDLQTRFNLSFGKSQSQGTATEGKEKASQKPEDKAQTDEAGEGTGSEGEGEAQEGKAEDAPTEPDKLDRLASQVERIANLVALAQSGNKDAERQLSQIAKQGLGLPDEQVSKTDSGPVTVRDYVTEENLQSVLTDPKEFNKVLQAAVADAVETTAKRNPALIQRIVAFQTQLSTKMAEYYTKNKDLLGFDKPTEHVMNALASDHPDWTMDKLFVELPKEVRKYLKLDNRQRTQKPTGIAQSLGSGARPAPKQQSKADVRSQISDMLKAQYGG